MSEQSAYRTERLSAVNLGDMDKLYMAVYKKRPATDFFQKKYDTAYTGTSFIGIIAYDAAGTPAAFYGAIPCFIEANGQRIPAAQSADTMTHPNHRNRGLFIWLAGITYQLCQQEGIQLLFGFPNKNSLHGFISKLDWQIPSYLKSFTLFVKSWPLEKISLKFSLLNPLYKAYVSLKLKKYLLHQNGIANSVSKEGFAGVYRDENYLRYKNTYHPALCAQIKKAQVWFKIQNGLIIGDIINFENDFDTIIQELKLMAQKIGVHTIRFEAQDGTALYNLLLNYAQPELSFPIIVKNLEAGTMPYPLAFTPADIDIF